MPKGWRRLRHRHGPSRSWKPAWPTDRDAARTLLAANRRLGDHGVELSDESDAEEREANAPAADAGAEREELTEEVFGSFLDDGDSGRRIDDPVRMYLTQMGEIPLLTRDQEINLAKRIEI